MQIGYLGTNLKFLRAEKKMTQDEVAKKLKMTRAKINAFENGVNLNPKIEDLIKFTDFFQVTIDNILKVNFQNMSNLQQRYHETWNYDEYIKGTKVRVLAKTVDFQNDDNIEFVPIKAKAGYTSGFSDPEFIETLNTFKLPVLSSNRKYRAFEIEGDSMLPIESKSLVITEYIDDWDEIKDGNAYVFVTKDEGIVFKIAFNKLRINQKVILHSLNPTFKDYEVCVDQIFEVWKYVCHLSNKIPNAEMTLEVIGEMIIEMKTEISGLKNKGL